ncbi:hypothetical protein PLICBS_003357 [Purpureocillium lilacinum]|uniref:uncharacterized protein n=1 Tax=Purpureocillium lilacinum TaxID=33203 RepID=UPI0020891625|nr:hypothetical protein PLICBS_003357 [Purpureocillium lilacinum]
MAFESISDLYATAFLSGVLLHVTVFRFGEWDMYFLTIVAGTLLLDLSATVAVRYGTAVGHESLWVAFQFVSSVLGCCVVGIFSSILVYRLAFHRLNKFPGPFLARISNIYPTALSLKEPKFQLHREVQALHRQYGDIVRLGPSELSISDPRAVDLIHSNQSRCYKGPWYNILWPTRPLNALRDRTAHAKRRRAWDKGMALRNYEPRVTQYAVQLLKRIDESRGQPMNVTKWFNFYGFDVMGDVGFGQELGMLREGETHYFMSATYQFMLVVRLFSHLVWLFPLYKMLPVVNQNVKRFEGWIVEQVQDRRKLARQPRALKLLQDEIDECYAAAGEAEPSAQALSRLEYLQACMTETLRMWPPSPSGLQRKTPPEGLQLGSVFIPGDVVVQNPQYTIYRGKGHRMTLPLAMTVAY